MNLERKTKIDLAIALLCALILGLAASGMQDEAVGMMTVCVSAMGLAVFLFLFLAGVARARASRPDGPGIDAGVISELLLLSEEDQALASWDMFGKMALVIGRDVGENHVDINLNESAYASLIDIEHAVLNYANGNWYIEDLGSKNGIVLQKKADGRKYKLSADQPCKLDQGDIIIVGLTRLLTK